MIFVIRRQVRGEGWESRWRRALRTELPRGCGRAAAGPVQVGTLLAEAVERLPGREVGPDAVQDLRGEAFGAGREGVGREATQGTAFAGLRLGVGGAGLEPAEPGADEGERANVARSVWVHASRSKKRAKASSVCEPNMGKVRANSRKRSVRAEPDEAPELSGPSHQGSDRGPVTGGGGPGSGCRPPGPGSAVHRAGRPRGA